MKPFHVGKPFLRRLTLVLVASAVFLHGWLSSAAGWSRVFLPLIGQGWPTPAPPYSPLLITEVLPDPAGEQPAGEWIELYNRGGSRFDLTDVKVGDEETEGGGEGMWGFPEEAAIQAGQVVVVANQATAFLATYGFQPDYELANTDPAVRDMWKYSNWGRGKVNLTGEGDEVLVLDPHNQLLDTVSWGNSSFAFDPGVKRPGTGQSLERKPADNDRNRASDWMIQEHPAPGQVDLRPPTPTATPSPTPSATRTLTPTMTQAPCGLATLLVTEVLYDPAEASDPQGEWMELINPTSQSVNLACVKIGDEETPGGGEGMLRFPLGAILQPGGVIVIANQALDFAAHYGFSPDYELSQTDEQVPDMLRYSSWASGSLNLSNGGDEFLILDGDDLFLDALSWGSSSFAFSPPVSSVAAGHSLERRPANRDTDTSGDWIDQPAPNPGHVDLAGETHTPTASPYPCGAVALLVSEVFYDPSLTSDPDGEWIEVYNLGLQPVNLGCLKIGDEETAGGGEAMLAFPAFATLEPGGVATIAYRGTTFAAAYGFLPSFEAVDSNPAIPDMVRYSTWANGSLNLSNSGDEVIILNGDDQLVDAVSWGASTFAFNPPVGPVPTGHSLERRPADRDTDRASDWIDQGSPRPGEVNLGPAPSSPTPTPSRTRTPSRTPTSSRTPTPRRTSTSTSTPTRTPAAIGLIINEVHADPDVSQGDANGDGRADSVEDEFLELVNTTGNLLDLSGWGIFDVVGERHTFAPGTTLANGCAIVVFGGGLPSGDFGGSLVQIASTGSLGLNERGDKVTIRDGNGLDMSTVTYGLEGDDNQSLTRDPDLTGPEPLVKHLLASGSLGARYSPGTRVGGGAFSTCGLLR
ncbi:MAG TPA: lamin tail domain-containing protein [Anaerolineales bacterium]|nr:lamin tail domain-containing protein [Anaerolineales bacterium]